MSILKNVNYMKRMLWYPCATPNPLLLIETAFEAGLPEVFELLSADWLDKALHQGKDMWRRAAARKAREHDPPRQADPPPRGHGRRIGGTFGRRSPGKKIGGREWLFELVDAEQTGMFWWLVADLATEFLARWTTLIYLKQGCPSPANCFAQGPFDSIFIGQGEALLILPVLSAGSIFSGGHVIQAINDTSYSIAFHGTLRVFNSDKPPTAARLELRGGLGTGSIYTGGNNGGDDGLGGRLSGSFYQHDRGAPMGSWELYLVNDSPTETVGCTSGLLTLSSGLCNNAAPAVPWDGNHLIPHPR